MTLTPGRVIDKAWAQSLDNDRAVAQATRHHYVKSSE
jgi:hypothetical protein